MRRIFNQRVGCLFVLVVVVSASAGWIYHLVSNPTVIAQQLAANLPPTATLPSLNNSLVESTPTSTPQPCSAKQRNFEMGMAFPQWSADGYGGGDQEWLAGLPDMRRQTGACWVEMPILLYQDSLTSTVITQGPSTPSVSAFAYGIQLAHIEGLHVFVTALLQVGGTQPWAGAIQFSTASQEQQWFQGYWQGLKPYLEAAAQAGAEQFALGTEEEWLQENAPTTLWNDLINNMHSAFPGALTYDMNWSDLQHPVPNWMRNPHLTMIGISAYLPQISSPQLLNKQQMVDLWKTTALPELDAFAKKLGRPILISEIGYRNSADALYQPWVSNSTAPADEEEQAEACSAALENIQPDKHIQGVFFWGWTEAGGFNLVNTQAAGTIHSYYQTWQV